MRPLIIDFLNTHFHVFFFKYLVPTGTIIYVTAMVSVMWIFVNRCRIVNLSTYHALSVSIYSMIAGIVGARVFYLLQNFERTLAHPLSILTIGGATTSWGAYFGGASTFFLYFYIKKIPALPYADALFSTLGIGPFIGRWACFFSGCCFGRLTGLPWGVSFPAHTPAYSLHVKLGLIESNNPVSCAVHPVQLYSSLAALIIFIITSFVWRRHNAFRGLTTTLYVFLYCTIRFCIEFFRADVPRHTILHLTLAQFLCTAIIVGTAAIVFYKRKPWPATRRLVP